MHLTVVAREPWEDRLGGRKGTREVRLVIEAVAIRADTFSGAGTAQMFYQARESAGTWYPLYKDDNRGKKLPRHKDFTVWTRHLQAVRGTRGLYQYTSEIIALAAERTEEAPR